MFVIVPVEHEAMPQLVGGVRFAQAAEAAQSVESKPPKAAMGSSGTDSDKLSDRTASALKRAVCVARPKPPVEFAMVLVIRSGLPATVARTGPAGTQRLRRRCAGSGVGAKYAPTPGASSHLAWSAHKLRGPTIARLRGSAQQGANPAAAPERAARPNPSLKRSANGRPPGPATGYGVHFPVAGPGVLPLSPA